MDNLKQWKRGIDQKYPKRQIMTPILINYNYEKKKL